MDDKTTTATTNTVGSPDHKSKLTYDDKVIKKIAGLATDDVPGILTVTSGFIGSLADRFRSDDAIKGVSAEVGEKQVALDLNVVCEYGQHVPEIFEEVQSRVSKAIREMTGLEVVELNMHVEDILRKKDMDALRQQQSAMNPSNIASNTTETKA